MALIAGTLNNASGVRPNTKIILTAYKTTSDVVTLAPDTTIITSATGAYSFECKPSFYNVRIQQPGYPCENVGIIQVYSDSVDGTINEFLTTFKPDDLTPEILKQCIAAMEGAEAASTAAEEAASTAANDAADEFSQQFQDRFNTLAPIKWESGLKVTNALQVYSYTDGQGVERSYLPNPKLIILPDGFTTGATFADDVKAGRFEESSILTQMKQWRSVGDIRGWGATGGSAAEDTAAFYSALSETDVIDLAGLALDVNVTQQYEIKDRDLTIKKGGLNLSSTTLTRVFKWVSGDLLRFENVKITGNSNGTIDDSFDTTSGTYSLVRAELESDFAAKNLQIDTCDISKLIVFEDDKNSVTSANKYRVQGGYCRWSRISDVAGHAFAFNCNDAFDIEFNYFKNIGALCADFGAFTSNCNFENNSIDGAAGIAKTQSRLNGGEFICPSNNSIDNNTDVKNLTRGILSNVAIAKLTGKNNTFCGNIVDCVEAKNADAIEIYGSCEVNDNVINQVGGNTRSYISTITDANNKDVNPVINIKGNRGGGVLNFARLQNLQPARVTIERNRPVGLQKFINGEPNLNLPLLSILDNEYSCDGSGAAMQFNTTTVSLWGLKVQGNTSTSESTGLVAVNADGASVSGNSFIHTSGNNVDFIYTESFTVIGNCGTSTWQNTDGNKIYGLNAITVGSVL